MKLLVNWQGKNIPFSAKSFHLSLFSCMVWNKLSLKLLKSTIAKGFSEQVPPTHAAFFILNFLCISLLVLPVLFSLQRGGKVRLELRCHYCLEIQKQPNFGTLQNVA